MNSRIGIALFGLGAVVLSHGAVAQTTAAPQDAPSTVQNGRSDSLSSKLNATGGVIKPTQDIDPGMHAPAPVAQPNSMPVIPPSATGGQNAK